MPGFFVGDGTDLSPGGKTLHKNEPAAARCGNGDTLVEFGNPIFFDDHVMAELYGYDTPCTGGPPGKCWA